MDYMGKQSLQEHGALDSAVDPIRFALLDPLSDCQQGNVARLQFGDSSVPSWLPKRRNIIRRLLLPGERRTQGGKARGILSYETASDQEPRRGFVVSSYGCLCDTSPGRI